MPKNIKDLDQLITDKGIKATEGSIQSPKEIDIY